MNEDCQARKLNTEDAAILILDVVTITSKDVQQHTNNKTFCTRKSNQWYVGQENHDTDDLQSLTEINMDCSRKRLKQYKNRLLK